MAKFDIMTLYCWRWYLFQISGCWFSTTKARLQTANEIIFQPHIVTQWVEVTKTHH